MEDRDLFHTLCREALPAIPRWNAFEVSDHTTSVSRVHRAHTIQLRTSFSCLFNYSRPLMRQWFPNHQSPEAYFYEVL